MAIVLGQKVRDKVSGFEGIATGRAVYINGCVRICIEPPVDKDGKYQEHTWLDESQLEVIPGGISVGEPKAEATSEQGHSSGGPRTKDDPRN